MKSTEHITNLYQLDDALIDDIKDAPKEAIEILIIARNTIREALDNKVCEYDEKILCNFIRDMIIKWCYENRIIY